MAPSPAPRRPGTIAARLVGAALAAAALLAVFYWRLPGRKADAVAAVLRVTAAGDAAGDVHPEAARREVSYQETQASLLTTRPVLQAALRDPRVAELGVVREHPDPLGWLEQVLRVESRAETRTLRVSLAGDRPAELAQLVNAVVRAYFREVVAPEQEQQRHKLAECERVYRENLAAIDKLLADVRDACRRGEEEARANAQRQLSLERSAGLHKELGEVAAKLGQAKRQLAQLDPDRPDEDKVPDELIDEQLGAEPAFARLRAQRDKLRRTIAQYEKVARAGPDSSPLVASSLRAYRADLQAVERQLDQRRREVRERLEKERRRHGLEAARQQRKQLEEQVARLTEEETRLRRRLDEQAKEMEKDVPNAWAELDRLLKEIERKQEVVKSFGKKCEQLRRDVEQAPRVLLVQEAAPG